MTKKFISITLAFCLIISCFTVISASAADTEKAKTGGQTISVDVSNCDTPNDPTSWYIWTWQDNQSGRLVDGHGEDAYNVYFDDCDDNVVFVRCPFGEKPNENWSNVWNQSGDERIQANHATVYWGDAMGAPLKVEWSDSQSNPDDNYGDDNPDDNWDDNPDDNPDDNWDDSDDWSTDYSDTNTVYLDPGDASGEWYAYTWSGETNTFVEGSQENGKYAFSGVMENVIFLTSSGFPETDWGNVNMQTEDLSAANGMTYKINGTVESTDISGNPMTKYGGDWLDSSENPSDDTYDDPDDNPDDNPDPYPITDDDTWTDPAPEIDPDPVVYPTSPANNPDENDDGPLTAKISLNGEVFKTQRLSGDAFNVTFTLKAPEAIVDGQATLEYNSSKLTIDSWEFPIVEMAVIDNLEAGDGMACFNFTSAKRPFDFTQGGVLVNVKFRPTASAAGTAAINLQIEELDSLDTFYVTNSVVSSQAYSLFESLKNAELSDSGQVSVDEPINDPSDNSDDYTDDNPSDKNSPDEPAEQQDTTQPPTNAPATQPSTKSNPSVKPTNPVVTPTNPVVTPSDPTVTQSPDYNKAKNAGSVSTATTGTTKTVSAAKKASAAKLSPVTVSIKDKTIKLKKLRKKAQKFKAVSVKNAPGKVTCKILKKGTSGKIYKKLKINNKGVIKLRKGKLKKGTYKIKIQIKIGGNARYTATVVKKTVKVKIK